MKLVYYISALFICSVNLVTQIHLYPNNAVGGGGMEVKQQNTDEWKQPLAMWLQARVHMSLCQKVLSEDHPFFGPKCFFRFKFSLNKPNFI